MRRIYVGFVVGVALLVAALLLLDVEQVTAVLVRADVRFVLAAEVVGLVGVGLLGEALRRLRRALSPATGSRLRTFFSAFLNAYFVRLLIPVGSSGAPAIYAYVLHRTFDTPFEEELAVSTAAELLNYGASAGLGLVGVLLFVLGGGQFAYDWLVAVAATALFLGAAGLLFVVLFRPGVVDRVAYGGAAVVAATLGRLSRRVETAVARERVEARLAVFHRTTEVLSGAPRAVALGSVLTVTAWLFTSLPLYLGVLALDAHVPFALVLFAVPLSGFMYVLPVSGGLGGIEVALGTFLVAGGGVEVPVAAAAVLLHRLATFWTPLVAGGLATAARPVAIPVERL